MKENMKTSNLNKNTSTSYQARKHFNGFKVQKMMIATRQVGSLTID